MNNFYEYLDSFIQMKNKKLYIYILSYIDKFKIVYIFIMIKIKIMLSRRFYLDSKLLECIFVPTDFTATTKTQF